jgi:hypothetical protein
MKYVVALVALLSVAGCGSREKQLVGTWKARPITNKPSANLSDVMRSSVMSFAAQGLTIEFNDKKAFKAAIPIANGGGSYKIDGDVVTLNFNTMAPSQPLKFKFKDEKTLEQVTEFESDPKIILDKQGQ